MLNYYEIGRDAHQMGVTKCPIKIRDDFTEEEETLIRAGIKEWWTGWYDVQIEQKCGFLI